MTPRASSTATAVVAPASKTAGPEHVDASPRATSTLTDYVNLTKPRLNALVIASSAAGYYLAARGRPDAWSMAEAVIGTTFVAAGAAVLNQVYERDTDRLMQRTRLRPLPDGRVGLADASVFGAALSVGGLALLALRASPVAAALALATLVVYLAIYTPMKRRTSLATLVGAVPGALPPLIGWAAAHGATSGLDAGGAALFAIVFLWQIPHFMAISWLYRDDYANAGFPLLPVIDPDGGRAGRQALVYATALLPASLMPALAGVTGAVYAAIATVLGAGLLTLSWRFAVARTDRTARALFLGSIAYLPLLWIAMIANHS
jgi:protoheme IX farnesyltransferase